MKRKPKTPKAAAVRIGSEDQELSRDYWEAEAKLAIQSIAEIGDENRRLRATVASQAELIKELKADNKREFTAGGHYVVGQAIEAAERWYGATAKIFGDCADFEPEAVRAVKAVRFFAEGAGSPLAQAAAMRFGAKAKSDQQPKAPVTIESLSRIVPMNHSGKTATDQ